MTNQRGIELKKRGINGRGVAQRKAKSFSLLVFISIHGRVVPTKDYSRMFWFFQKFKRLNLFFIVVFGNSISIVKSRNE